MSVRNVLNGRRLPIVLAAAALTLAGCDDDDSNSGGDPGGAGGGVAGAGGGGEGGAGGEPAGGAGGEAGGGGEGGAGGDPVGGAGGEAGGGGEGGAGGEPVGGAGGEAGGGGEGGAGGGEPETALFEVRVENISGASVQPSPFAPGVWWLHDGDASLFTDGEPDRGEGLEALAEDGSPAELVESLEAAEIIAGAFTTPEGAEGPGPLFPGQSYVFTVEASAETPYLGLATMYVQSNDLFFNTDTPIALFDDAGAPIAQALEVEGIGLWDSGTESNEAPAMGPNQAPRQAGPDTGAMEGVVRPFNNSTRAIPNSLALVDVEVAETEGGYTIDIINISGEAGLLPTPIAPVFWATHDDTWSLFEAGAPDRGEGLEILAEDGSPMALVASHTGAEGIGAIGAAPITVERPEDDPGPAFPGERYRFTVSPTAEAPYLTLAAMVVQSNDAFLAPPASGVPLLDDAGNLRPATEIRAAIKATLQVWDAGTEMNQVPGVGPDQAPRQDGGNTGADENGNVRIYSDATNDLSGPGLGGFASVTVVPSEVPGSFEITVANTSAGTAFPGVLTPVAWAIHDGASSMFTAGAEASAGLEALAEDGDPAGLVGELEGAEGVEAAGVMAMAVGAEAPGPIFDGGMYTFTVTPSADARFLSLTSMVVPSNDTFLALTGVALLDEAGEPRPVEMIAADIEGLLGAWDAGTEANQAGAGGADQAPRQAGPDTGAAEGDGTVRLADEDVWPLPMASRLIRVVVTPVE
ncbi:MAG: spondin domain-containing protein [Bradymonadia bacterium]